MDGQFTTLLRSYHDNYIQYALTGGQSYQTAYQSAQQGLDTIIASLQSEVNAQKDTISSFYKSKPEESIRDLESQTLEMKRQLVAKNDALTAAKLRSEVPTFSSPSMVPFYVPIGVLAGLSVLLSVI
jgi:hypothetical protein